MEANEAEVRENQSGSSHYFRRIVPHCFSDWTTGERTQKDIEFSNYVACITRSRWFHARIMLTTFLDAILSTLETKPHLEAPTRQLLPGHRRAVRHHLRHRVPLEGVRGSRTLLEELEHHHHHHHHHIFPLGAAVVALGRSWLNLWSTSHRNCVLFIIILQAC